MMRLAFSATLKTVRVAATLLSITLVVVILSWAKVVLIPVALAVMLTFILSPLVTRLDRWGLRRVLAVIVVVAIASLPLAGLSWLVGAQLHNLANDLPNYRENLRVKIAALRGGTEGALENVRSTLQDATGQPEKSKGVDPKAGSEQPSNVREPMPVRIVPDQGPEKAVSAALASVLALSPALEGLATGGLALVLVVFMLIKREDLRNRLVSFTAHGSMVVTTKALDDAGQRISQYLIMQLIVNGTFGLAVGVGLLVIGVPYALLWGLCAAIFRYVPYIGPWVAALLPLTVSLITSPAWTQMLLVLGLFLVLELVSNNLMEPWLYGQGIGVSEVALLVSAAFWTWMWGPVGLVLATPLTVCLVVIGKYAPALAFLDRLLGDRPALEPHMSYFQRLLARDQKEAHDVAAQQAETNGPGSVCDNVLLPALLLTRRDRKRGALTAEDETYVFQATREIMDHLLPETATVGEADDQVLPPGSDATAISRPNLLILGCPAHHEAEELSLQMLAHLLKPEGCRVEILSTRALPAEVEARVKREKPALAFIAVLPPGGLVQALYLCKRLRKRFAELPLVIGCWGAERCFDRLLVRLRKGGASYLTTSLLQSRSQILALVAAPAPAEPWLPDGALPQAGTLLPAPGELPRSGLRACAKRR